MSEPLTLREITRLLIGLLDAGADPDKPVALQVGAETAFADTVSVTTDEEYDECDIWIGASE